MQPTDQLADRKVLVVDDDVDALQLYATALAKLGAEVRTARSAEQAVATLNVWLPDVMLCDLQLPEADGYDLLEGIRTDGRFSAMPVVAISAAHPAVERERSLRAGFAQHIAKPSKLVEIVASLLAVLTAQLQPSSADRS